MSAEKVALIDAEREAIHTPMLCDCDDTEFCPFMQAHYRDIERIVAARVAEAIEQERAAWAAKVEALAVRLVAAADSAGLAHKVGSGDTHAGQRLALLLAASEARVLLSVDGTEALDAAKAEAARQAAPLIRRAILDPGAFVKRGPDYDGEPYGERLDQWQDRAIGAALLTAQEES